MSVCRPSASTTSGMSAGPEIAFVCLDKSPTPSPDIRKASTEVGIRVYAAGGLPTWLTTLLGSLLVSATVTCSCPPQRPVGFLATTWIIVGPPKPWHRHGLDHTTW